MKATILAACLVGAIHPAIAHDRRADNQLEAAADLYQRGKTQEAFDKYKSALSYGERGDAYFFMALCQMKNGEYAEAIKWLEKAKPRQPLPHPAPRDKVHFGLGECQLHLGEIENAIKNYSEAARIAKKEPRYLEALATAYDQAGNAGKAAEARQKAAAIRQKQHNRNVP